MKFKINTSIKAFNLIEMVVTMGLVVILSSMAIINLAKSKPSKDIIDEVTTLISGVCSQVAVESLNLGGFRNICSIRAGTGSDRASCDLSGSGSKFVWANINNNVLNNKVEVTVVNNNAKIIQKIGYSQGIINNVRYFGENADTIIDNSLESDISPINIKIGLIADQNCYNTIELWPNNVITINEHCARADLKK